MVRSLPPRPSLRFLSEQAKDLLKAHKQGDVQVCQTLRLLQHYRKASKDDILAAKISLQEAQHALAMDYGFKGWSDLRRHVEGEGKLSPKQAALEFVERHGPFPLFHPLEGWYDKHVDEAGQQALEIAEQFKGTEIAPPALLIAAKAAGGRCGFSPDETWHRPYPLYPDGWDRAIALYQRVVDEHPDTEHAVQAQWFIASCHGTWPWAFCCRDNRGKGDWEGAIELYEQFYRTSGDPGSKCEASRRIAEILMHCLGQWRDGLRTYRQIVEEFPHCPPPSPYRTNRTCAAFRGTDGIASDILVNTGPACRYTHREQLAGASGPDEAAAIHEEFVRLGPPLGSIRFHGLLQLEAVLRRAGRRAQADEIRRQVGLCDRWLVVGPFFDAEHKEVFEPKRDFLAGEVDLAKTYKASTEDGRAGTAMWIPAGSVTRGDIWEIGDYNNCTALGDFFALTTVESPTAQPAHLRIGASGPTVVWLNGEEVFATDVLIVPEPVLDQDIQPVHLQAGANQLFVEFRHRVNAYFRSENFLRVTGPDGNALPGVTYAAPDVPNENRSQASFLRQG